MSNNFEDITDNLLGVAKSISEKFKENSKSTRYPIFKNCEKFNNQLKLCMMCKCFMPLKTLLPHAKCPLNKW
jgi:hypothetical protein